MMLAFIVLLWFAVIIDTNDVTIEPILVTFMHSSFLRQVHIGELKVKD